MTPRGATETEKETPTPTPTPTAKADSQNNFDNVIIGDIGGTNVRFQLIRLFHDDPEKNETLKPLTKMNPRDSKSL